MLLATTVLLEAGVGGADAGAGAVVVVAAGGVIVFTYYGAGVGMNVY